MEAAGNIGGRNQRQHLFIQANLVGTKAFTQVGIQIDFHTIPPNLYFVYNIQYQYIV